MNRIPLVDLKAQYAAHRDEFDAAVKECIENTAFIGGPAHKGFSEAFADYCGGGHVTLCGNGTDAIYLAIVELMGFGEQGQEIITVPNTFIATTEAIIRAGYTPVFVDVSPDTLLMNPELLENAISPKTKGILPVHLFGQMAPMDHIMAIADNNGLIVIEDAAQAHGARWQGKGPGQWGHAATFSFYPGKNLGAWGDGGAVFTQDQSLAERMTMHANHGRKGKYLHEAYGVNSRLDGLQAAVLSAKLPHMQTWTAKRRSVAAKYSDLLSDVSEFVLPETRQDAEHVFHLYVVRLNDRDRILNGLHERGIGAGVHYPVPLHEQPAYASMNIPAEALPVASDAAKRQLSLPMFPELTDEQIITVVDALKELVGETDA